MRTTVTLDQDVAAAVEHLRREKGLGVSAALNDLVRRGLAGKPTSPKRFIQDTSSMGAPRLPLDNVAEVLAALEGDAAR